MLNMEMLEWTAGPKGAHMGFGRVPGSDTALDRFPASIAQGSEDWNPNHGIGIDSQNPRNPRVARIPKAQELGPLSIQETEKRTI